MPGAERATKRAKRRADEAPKRAEEHRLGVRRRSLARGHTPQRMEQVSFHLSNNLSRYQACKTV